MNRVTVKLDRAHLTARMRRGKEHCGPFLGEQILGNCRPFVPHDQGKLEDSGKVEKVGEDYAVTWDTVYAAYQYYGCWPDGSHVIKNHDTRTNKEATTQWVEAAKKRYKKDWDTVAQREFVKGANG